MENTFVIGDVVVLKSGGPKMTIQNLGQYVETNNGAYCKWFEGTTVKEDLFDANCLKKVDE